VTSYGTGFVNVTSVKFNGRATGYFVASGTQIKATVPSGATTGRITVTAANGTATSATTFTPTLAIWSFSPTSGPHDTVVTVNGVGFNSSSRVKFNGAAATTTFVSSGQLRAVVPASASRGTISVTNTTGTVGTVFSSGTYIVTPFIAPHISSFTPTSGPTGTQVTINGNYFNGATSVKFNGRAATFTVVSGSQIVATVPNGITTGPITVTTAAGTGTSTSNYTVTFSIVSFSPTSGSPGETVSITGVGFNSSSQVRFNGVAATERVVSANRIDAIVPSTATSGKITVTNTNSFTKATTTVSSYKGFVVT
jgi:large repetitive protein